MGEGVHKWMYNGDLCMKSEIDVCMGGGKVRTLLMLGGG